MGAVSDSSGDKRLRSAYPVTSTCNLLIKGIIGRLILFLGKQEETNTSECKNTGVLPSETIIRELPEAITLRIIAGTCGWVILRLRNNSDADASSIGVDS